MPELDSEAIDFRAASESFAAFRKLAHRGPLWYGGGQELGMRSGTEPVPSIVGLATAARRAREARATYDRMSALRDHFERALGDVTINGKTQPRLGNTPNVSFDGSDVTAIVLALDEAGVCMSGGAACHSGRMEPTATMKAMGRPAAVRFSLSRYTTAEEIDRAINALSNVAPGFSRLQPGVPVGLSPPELLVPMAVQTRHDSIRTEAAYVAWEPRHFLFDGRRHPSAMGADDINASLSHIHPRGGSGASRPDVGCGAARCREPVGQRHITGQFRLRNA